MTADQKLQVDQVDLRCLNICIEMLGRVNSVGSNSPPLLEATFYNCESRHLKKTSHSRVLYMI